MNLIAIVGLQGVGKSRYIKEHYPNAKVVDYERGYKRLEFLQDEHLAPTRGMHFSEKATFAKVIAAQDLAWAVAQAFDEIVVECTGMSPVNQASILGMMAIATGYRVKVVYLKPEDYADFAESIKHDPDAVSMLEAFWYKRNGFWREPDQCPYFEDVRIVEVNHSTWTFTDEEPGPELWEVAIVD